MGRRLQLRAVSEEEQGAVKRLAHSRTAPARTVERAQVVEAALAGAVVEEIAVQRHLSRATVYLWLHRFEERGSAGSRDSRISRGADGLRSTAAIRSARSLPSH